MIGRGALALFVGVVVLLLAQVAWWMIFLVRIGVEQRHLVMFASEGAFFVVVILTGVFIMYRTLAEQVRLKSLRATFLSAVTHELKSPLAAIRLFLETLEEDRVDEHKRKDLVRKMILDADRLDRLVADLLRAGQIESHALVPDLEEVDLLEVARECVEHARPRLRSGESIEVGSARSVVARADRSLIRSAVENLIDNAIKYAPEPRSIRILLDEAGGEARIRVEDSGPGVDRAIAARAFEPFVRGGDEMTRSAKGTGLGLFIVRGIADAHGGRAYFEAGRPVIALPRVAKGVAS